MKKFLSILAIIWIVGLSVSTSILVAEAKITETILGGRRYVHHSDIAIAKGTKLETLKDILDVHVYDSSTGEEIEVIEIHLDISNVLELNEAGEIVGANNNSFRVSINYQLPGASVITYGFFDVSFTFHGDIGNQKDVDGEINSAIPSFEHTLPIYGYVGADADIIDPDPTDPDVDVEFPETGTLLSVSIPTKIIWASFASEGGKITSPNYMIENHSKFGIDVEVSDFKSSTSNLDCENIFGKLNLTLNDVNLSKFLTGESQIEYLTDIHAGDSYIFSLKGRYTGEFITQLTPSYHLTLRFIMQ